MDWSYVAGFFDGEGSVIFTKNSIKLQFSNTDKQMLKKLHKFLGCGNIRFSYRNLDKWKPQGVLVVGKHEDVIPILDKLKDLCIIKKSKIKKAIDYYENKKWHYQQIDMERLTKLRNNGMSIRKIAEEMNLSRSTVHNRIRFGNIV